VLELGDLGRVLVVHIGIDEDVQVLRVARLGVMDDRVAADNDVPNSMPAEKRQEFAEVGVQVHPGPREP
jgi:hypothetical protein